MLKKFIFYSFFILLALSASPVLACDTCGCALARGTMKEISDQKPLFFDFTFEQQNWDVMDARAAHTLHHQGHDFHDKTTEEFYHFTLGATPVADLTVLAEIPYVVRGSLDVEHHSTLGNKQTSEGIGDLNVLAVYRLLKKEDNFLGPVVGVKFPTGSTTERDPVDDRFEPELQPGTSSYDYTVGAAFQYDLGPLVFHGNSLYVIKTKGDQDFQYGDLFSTYLYADYLINPGSPSFQTKIGVDANLQIDGKQTEAGVKVDDSGGNTLLLGPALAIKINDNASLFGNILFPVYQHLGGVHQELDFVWNAGAKIAW